MSGDILDITETPAGIRVTWLDDDIDAVEQTADVEAEHERAEPDVGIRGGHVATGDAPEWVLERVAAWHEAQAAGRWEDAAERRAAERRADGAW